MFLSLTRKGKLMPKVKSERGVVVDTKELKKVCLACKAEFMASIRIYENSDEVVAQEGRCAGCQTKYRSGARLSIVLKGLEGLGNMKTRLSDTQKAFVLEQLSEAMSTVAARYEGCVEPRKSIAMPD